eukprot:COSAG05_NODE_669_length_7998_cov_24.003671_4_plen_82_part_00
MDCVRLKHRHMARSASLVCAARGSAQRPNLVCPSTQILFILSLCVRWGPCMGEGQSTTQATRCSLGRNLLCRPESVLSTGY